MHFVVTDSGLGGLGICAAIENAFRRNGTGGGVRLTYFNAWPEQERGYNMLPDEAARLAFLDRALARMGALQPDRIVIACNTLSVLFPLTGFAGSSSIPVIGIIDAGVDMFYEALIADTRSSIVLFGTRITMESGVHRDRLVQRGVSPGRIIQVPSHGLAAAIERDAGGAEVGRLIDEATARAAASLRHDGPALAELGHDGPVLAGLCCTHYGYVADWFQSSLERAVGRSVRVLDPNGALVHLVAPPAPNLAGAPGAGAQAGAEDDSTGSMPRVAENATTVSELIPGMAESTEARNTVKVVSKVRLERRTCEGIGRLVASVSPATERALLSYTHVPDLF